MRAFLATVLSVIAVGVLLIAYGLLVPRTAATGQVSYDPQTGTYSMARPMFASERVLLPDGTPAYGYQYPAASSQFVGTPAGYRQVGYNTPVDYPAAQAPVVRTRTVSAPRRVVSSRAVADRRTGRDWKKTALVIGGSTATGAGVGAIVGGKKGALIGAAIGGGASTLWEAKH
jgi:hypothetical protein